MLYFPFSERTPKRDNVLGRHGNSPFWVPASLSLAQTLTWQQSGIRNRFTPSTYRLGAAIGFLVRQASLLAAKGDLWTNLLTKAYKLGRLLQ